MAGKIVHYVNKSRVYHMMNARYVVDLHFVNQRQFENAVSLGFDKDFWEKKNHNKVIIYNDKTCYKCDGTLDKDCSFGVCKKCTDEYIEWMDKVREEYKEKRRIEKISYKPCQFLKKLINYET